MKYGIAYLLATSIGVGYYISSHNVGNSILVFWGVYFLYLIYRNLDEILTHLKK